MSESAIDPAAPQRGTDDPMSAHLGPLADLDQRPLGEHAERFAAVHASLQAALTEIDAAG